MIVRFMPAGRSFRWLATYLEHDAGKAQTTHRVPWTHTINLPYDDVPSAVHTMFNTYCDRDLLRTEAGLTAKGTVEKPVKHFSLNWHPSEQPTRDEMIAAVESLLRKMGWQNHQCVLFPHTDKPHPHVHVMLNAIDPDRGERLNDRFERRRAQEWALDYERAHGIHCEERLKPTAERAKSPPRHVWLKLRAVAPAKEASPDLDAAHSAPSGRQTPGALWRADEWRSLKQHQKAARLGFVADGKTRYRQLRHDLYRQVRSTFRHEWRDFYALKRARTAPAVLARVKEDLLKRQNAAVGAVCAAATTSLRKERDQTYKTLLERHKAERAELANRQEKGLRSPHLIGSGGLVGVAHANLSDGLTTSDAARSIETHAPQRWTQRAGMSAQQRSARRWLDRAISRLEERPVPRNARDGPLARAGERISRKEQTAQKTGPALGIEPDG